jgi:hypothetical protein
MPKAILFRASENHQLNDTVAYLRTSFGAASHNLFEPRLRETNLKHTLQDMTILTRGAFVFKLFRRIRPTHAGTCRRLLPQVFSPQLGR